MTALDLSQIYKRVNVSQRGIRAAESEEEHWTFFRFVSRLALLSKGWSSSYDSVTRRLDDHFHSGSKSQEHSVHSLLLLQLENKPFFSLSRKLWKKIKMVVRLTPPYFRSPHYGKSIRIVCAGNHANWLLLQPASSQKSQVPFYHQLTFLLKPLEASKRKQLDEEHFISSLRVFQDWIRTPSKRSFACSAAARCLFLHVSTTTTLDGDWRDNLSSSCLSRDENVSHEPLTFLLLPFITASCFSEILIPISLITIIQLEGHSHRTWEEWKLWLEGLPFWHSTVFQNQ